MSMTRSGRWDSVPAAAESDPPSKQSPACSSPSRTTGSLEQHAARTKSPERSKKGPWQSSKLERSAVDPHVFSATFNHRPRGELWSTVDELPKPHRTSNAWSNVRWSSEAGQALGHSSPVTWSTPFSPPTSPSRTCAEARRLRPVLTIRGCLATLQGRSKAIPRDLHGKTEYDKHSAKQQQEYARQAALEQQREQMTPRVEKQRRWRKAIASVATKDVEKADSPAQLTSMLERNRKGGSPNSSAFLSSPRTALWSPTHAHHSGRDVVEPLPQRGGSPDNLDGAGASGSPAQGEVQQGDGDDTGSGGIRLELPKQIPARAEPATAPPTVPYFAGDNETIRVSRQKWGLLHTAVVVASTKKSPAKKELLASSPNVSHRSERGNAGSGDLTTTSRNRRVAGGTRWEETATDLKFDRTSEFHPEVFVRMLHGTTRHSEQMVHNSLGHTHRQAGVTRGSSVAR